MIIGIGSDLIDITRIEATIRRFGDRFLDRIFTPVERARSERRRLSVESYAKRFAAKEACAKALGTGFRRGVFWRDMGVVNLPSGRPTLTLTGGAGYDGFCALRGSIEMPQFQAGAPPFDTEGRFVLDGNDAPLVQATQTIPVTITLPKQAMPASGWPLYQFFHGSGGLSTGLVDLGRQA